MPKVPYVKISFDNGAIGQKEAVGDGICALSFVSAMTAKMITSAEEAAGCPDGVKDLVKAFYAEAGDGTSLWLAPRSGLDTTEKWIEDLPAVLAAMPSDVSCVGIACEKFLRAGGKADTLALQTLLERTAKNSAMPMMCLLPMTEDEDDETGFFAGEDLTAWQCDRIAAVAGAVNAGSPYSPLAMAAVLGRIASTPCHRSLTRVKDGCLSPLIESYGCNADMTQRGVITLREWVGKHGWYITDDHLMEADASDYAYIPRRRTADKLYKVVYSCLVDAVGDEVPVDSRGCPSVAWAKDLQNTIGNAIDLSMNANLGKDPDDEGDKGYSVSVDTEQDIATTSTLYVTVRAKPFGYAKYIECGIGYTLG